MSFAILGFSITMPSRSAEWNTPVKMAFTAQESKNINLIKAWLGNMGSFIHMCLSGVRKNPLSLEWHKLKLISA